MLSEKILKEAARILTARAGSVRSKAKTQAARVNGKLGGRPRQFPRCKRYGSHRFSPTTGQCPCGFHKPAKSSKK